MGSHDGITALTRFHLHVGTRLPLRATAPLGGRLAARSVGGPGSRPRRRSPCAHTRGLGRTPPDRRASHHKEVQGSGGQVSDQEVDTLESITGRRSAPEVTSESRDHGSAAQAWHVTSRALALLARRVGDARLADIARWLGLSTRSASSVISAAEALEQRDPAFCRLVGDSQGRLLWRGRKIGSNRQPEI